MSLVSSKRVPPSGPYDADILVIGEAPGKEENDEGIPFVGDSGKLLRGTLKDTGFDEGRIRFANLSNHRPNDNRFEHLYVDGSPGPELLRGVKELNDYITERGAGLKGILLLGERPLNFMAGKYGIYNWRGSPLLRGNGAGQTIIIPTKHPAYILRDRREYPIFAFDIAKFGRYVTNGYTRPTHNFTIDPRGPELELCVREIISAPRVALDIENVEGRTTLLCVGFALSKERSICIVNHMAHMGTMDPAFESALQRICAADNEKIMQYGIHDVTVLRENGIEVNGYEGKGFDTNVAMHVLEPEMERTLAFLTSLYTDEPYYKDRGKDAIPKSEKGWSEKVNKITLYEYNCLDGICTFQAARAQEQELKKRQLWEFFQYEFNCISVARHIIQAGMLVDEERRDTLRAIIKHRVTYYQVTLNTLCGRHCNVNGKIVLRDILYNQLGLPVQKKKDKDGTYKITADEDAIVALVGFCKNKENECTTAEGKFGWQKKLGILKLILLIRGFLKLESTYIDVKVSKDGRVRSMYWVAATDTGRWNSSSYVDDTGFNAQTMPREVLEIELSILEKLERRVAA